MYISNLMRWTSFWYYQN